MPRYGHLWRYSRVVVFISQFHENQMFSFKNDPCIWFCSSEDLKKHKRFENRQFSPKKNGFSMNEIIMDYRLRSHAHVFIIFLSHLLDFRNQRKIMSDFHMSIHIFVLLIFTCYSCDDYLFVLFYINFTPPNCSFEIYAYFLLFTFLNKLFRLKR